MEKLLHILAIHHFTEVYLKLVSASDAMEVITAPKGIAANPELHELAHHIKEAIQLINEALSDPNLRFRQY